MKKLIGLILIAGILTACDENGIVQVKENKADTVFDKVDSTAEAVGDSAKQTFKELKRN